MGPSHKEAPERIRILEQSLREATFETNFVKSDPATPKEIMRIHSKNLYNLVKASQSKGNYTFTPDTIANKYTYQAALTAVGGSLQTGINTYRKTSFAMLRPPGHHATSNLAMGFCFFNNIAIAAKHLQITKNHKVAIIDLDNHHGNGTQEIFYDDPEVLYASMHAAPNIAFPGTGFADELGTGEAKGTTINVPLPYKTTDDEYLFAFDSIVDPIIKKFRPKTILVSLGLDALDGDPYGILGLTPAVYTQLGKRIADLNATLTNNYVGAFLEGGYKYEEIGKAANNFFGALLDPDQQKDKPLDPSERIQNLVYSIRSSHRNPWFAI